MRKISLQGATCISIYLCVRYVGTIPSFQQYEKSSQITSEKTKTYNTILNEKQSYTHHEKTTIEIIFNHSAQKEDNH